jgi:2-isopropylmalate synthase
MGYGLDDRGLDVIFEHFKALADKKKFITDADLEALISVDLYQPGEVFSLDGLQVVCGTMGMPTATVRLRGPDGEMHVQVAIGTGPVDAVYKAMDAIIQSPATLEEFSIHAVTEGIDALGEVTVRIEGSQGPAKVQAQSEFDAPRTYGGYGADTDIVVASAKAYLAAMNKILVASGSYPTPSLEHLPSSGRDIHTPAENAAIQTIASQ